MNLPTGDQVKVIGSEDGTACTLFRGDSSGRVTEDRFTVNQGGIFTRDVVSGNSYRIMCNRRVFVAQVGIAQVTFGEQFLHQSVFIFPMGNHFSFLNTLYAICYISRY